MGMVLLDFVYLVETEKTESNKKTVEKTLNKITGSTEIDDLKVIPDYNGYIAENRLGVYQVTSETEYVEVVLTRSKEKEGEYSRCQMAWIDSSKLEKNHKYQKLHLVLNQDNVVMRAYAIKEIGITYSVGIIKNIEVQKSGDEVTSRKIYVTADNKSVKRMNIAYTDNLQIGDMITYDIQKATDKKEDDTIKIGEIYDRKLIGNTRDLIVEEYKSGKIKFSNTEDIIDLNQKSFQIGENEYELEDYLIVSAEVTKDASEDWIFKYFTLPTNKSGMKLKEGSRFVIDELTRVIVIYNGYEK